MQGTFDWCVWAQEVCLGTTTIADHCRMHLAGHGEKHDEESVKAGNEAETNNDVETKQVKQNNIAEDGNGNKIDGDGEGGGGNIDDDSLEEKKPNEKPDVKKPDQIENPQDDNGEDDGNGDGDDNVDSKGDGDGKRDGNGDHDANGDGDGDGGVNGDGGGKGEGEGDNKPDVKLDEKPNDKNKNQKTDLQKGKGGNEKKNSAHAQAQVDQQVFETPVLAQPIPVRFTPARNTRSATNQSTPMEDDREGMAPPQKRKCLGRTGDSTSDTGADTPELVDPKGANPQKSQGRVNGQYAGKAAKEVENMLDQDFASEEDKQRLRAHVEKLEGFMNMKKEDYEPQPNTRRKYRALLQRARARLAHPNNYSAAESRMPVAFDASTFFERVNKTQSTVEAQLKESHDNAAALSKVLSEASKTVKKAEAAATQAAAAAEKANAAAAAAKALQTEKTKAHAGACIQI